MAKGGGDIFFIGIIGALAYVTRNTWLPAVESAFGSLTASGATGNNPAAPTLSTGNQPVSGAIPGAVPLGNQGCYQYATSTTGQLIINCPPGVNPPSTATPQNNCAEGFTLDAGGICTRYPDNVVLAQLNSLPWTGLQDIPAEQINRIDPQILDMYSTTTGVNSGTILAYMLGLGANPADGKIAQGSDGNIYKALGGVFYRQGTATSSTTGMQGLGGLRATRAGLGAVKVLTNALPITPGTLIMASSNPVIAKLVGRDPRAMLTAQQWNAYYTQATGIVQGIPLHPADMQGALMSAEQYQVRRAAAGLTTTANLGMIRPARRGAFPLAGLGLINQWVPPGNRTIYQIPGRGAVPAGRGGAIPAHMGLIGDGGGNHRWARSPFPRPAWWREAE